MRFPWTRDWELTSTVQIPSPLQAMVDTGRLTHVDRVTDPDLYRTTVFYTFKCKLTGRVKVEKVTT